MSSQDLEFVFVGGGGCKMIFLRLLVCCCWLLWHEEMLALARCWGGGPESETPEPLRSTGAAGPSPPP